MIEYNRSNYKIFIMELSTYCINRCDGCIYTVKERGNKNEMDIIKFRETVSKLNRYCQKRGLIPHFLFGIGETLELEGFFEFLDVVLEETSTNELTDSDGKNVVIEIATTGRIPDYEDKLDLIIRKASKQKAEIIMEFVINGLNTKEYNIIEQNLRYTKKKNIQTHNVFKSSVNYEKGVETFLKNLSSINLEKADRFIIDYLKFEDFERFTLKDFSGVFEKIKETTDGTNFEFANLKKDYNYHKENQHNYAYYITKDFDLNFVAESPFGDIMLNQEILANEKFVNLVEAGYRELETHLDFYIKKIEQKNSVKREQYGHCKSCPYNKSCPIYFIEQTSKKHSIEFSPQRCLGGRHLLNLF